MLEAILQGALTILAIVCLVFLIVTVLCMIVAFIWITIAEIRDDKRRRDKG